MSDGLLPGNDRDNAEFGQFWKTYDGGYDWYKWMYEYRGLQHRAFHKWSDFVSAQEPLHSVADFGCGAAIGHPEHFRNIRFIGLDLSPAIIADCQKRNQNPLHEYRCTELLAGDLGERFDLAFSSGTIDNVYDMDGFLRALVRASRRWIYLTAYRGYFTGLKEHIYRYDEKQHV